jgi:hypothetical protein
MAAGGATHVHGGEVAGVGASAGYGGSGVTGASQKRRGRLCELTGGALTTRPGSERGERRRKGSGRVGATPARNRGRGEGGLRRARAWTNFSRVRGTSGTDAGAPDRANSTDHRAGVADRRGRTPAKPKLVDDKA